MFNNRIYGLTKGQYSPTSREGTRSPSTPMGSVDHPVSATSFALGAGAREVRPGAHRAEEHGLVGVGELHRAGDQHVAAGLLRVRHDRVPDGAGLPHDEDE